MRDLRLLRSSLSALPSKTRPLVETWAFCQHVIHNPGTHATLSLERWRQHIAQTVPEAAIRFGYAAASASRYFAFSTVRSWVNRFNPDGFLVKASLAEAALVRLLLIAQRAPHRLLLFTGQLGEVSFCPRAHSCHCRSAALDELAGPPSTRSWYGAFLGHPDCKPDGFHHAPQLFLLEPPNQQEMASRFPVAVEVH